MAVSPRVGRMGSVTRMGFPPTLTRMARMVRLTRLTRLTLDRRTRVPIHNMMDRATCVTTATRNPIQTTPNRMAGQNRLVRLTAMGRLRWLTILIMPTWRTRMDKRTCVTARARTSSTLIYRRLCRLTGYT